MNKEVEFKIHSKTLNLRGEGSWFPCSCFPALPCFYTNVHHDSTVVLYKLQSLFFGGWVKIMSLGAHRSPFMNVLFLKFAGPFLPDFGVVCMAPSFLLGDRSSCDRCILMTQHICQKPRAAGCISRSAASLSLGLLLSKVSAAKETLLDF